MTEADWENCNDPDQMLEVMRPEENRKAKRLRQFCIACCCRIWHLLPEEARQLVRTAEDFEDGSISRAQRDRAVASFRAIHGRFGADAPCLRAAYRCKNTTIDVFTARLIAGDTVSAVTLANVSAMAAERAAQTGLVRCIFGSPFRPAVNNPSWLSNTVARLAEAICEDRAFDRLPIFADALEEAGCTNPDILNHCRQPGEHVRGCWVIDLLTGRS